MSETGPPPVRLPESRVERRRAFNPVWLIPIVAAAIAAYLAWHAIQSRGETITITFSTAQGLTAGQTRIRHKAVDLGTVQRITLSRDMSHVIIQAQMRREADRFLTSNARFWVVRPRLTIGNVSGLETLVSGSYIEMDPGAPGGQRRTEFTGLEEPPAIRSDEPGHSFVLKADRIGSLASGSPVFFRDIAAGEVLGFDVHPSQRAEDTFINIHIFVRAPFDKFVHKGSYFWNASGLSVQLGAEGVRLQLESVQALLTGGIAFDTPPPPLDGPASLSNAVFRLYGDRAAAVASGTRDKLQFVVYVKGSVRGLAVGAPVELYGIPIGAVSGIHLDFDPTGLDSRVAIHFEVQPERIFGNGNVPDMPPREIARRLVAKGMRVQLRSANFVTGQLLVAMDFFPDQKAGEVRERDGAIVLPTVPGQLEGLTASLGQILQKLQALPLDETVQRLNATLAGLDELANGPDLKSGLRNLSATLATLQSLLKEMNSGIAPALERMPQLVKGLQATLEGASRLLNSADAGYGAHSQVRRDLERLMDEASDALRSVRLLADFLDQHPEALLRGRTGQAGAP